MKLKKKMLNLSSWIFGSKIFEYLGFLQIRRIIFGCFFKLSGNCSFGNHIEFTCGHAGTVAKVHIGKNVDIGGGCQIEVGSPLTIGDYVWISEYAIILTHIHKIHDKNRLKEEQECILTEGLVIEEDAWVGERSMIMPQVNYIGKGAIIGGGGGGN